MKLKRKEGRFPGAMMAPMATSLIAPMASSLIQSVASSLINSISGKDITRAGKRQEGEFCRY